jgi:hypothetical protein
LAALPQLRPEEAAKATHCFPTTGYGRGLDGFTLLINGRSFEIRPNVSA